MEERVEDTNSQEIPTKSKRLCLRLARTPILGEISQQFAVDVAESKIPETISDLVRNDSDRDPGDSNPGESSANHEIEANVEEPKSEGSKTNSSDDYFSVENGKPDPDTLVTRNVIEVYVLILFFSFGKITPPGRKITIVYYPGRAKKNF